MSRPLDGKVAIVTGAATARLGGRARRRQPPRPSTGSPKSERRLMSPATGDRVADVNAILDQSTDAAVPA
jgi:hypothetical protein